MREFYGGTVGLSTPKATLYRGIITLLGEFCQNWIDERGSGSENRTVPFFQFFKLK